MNYFASWLQWFCIIAVVFFGYHGLLGVSVGSNTTPSRQARVEFPYTDANNTMLGFAVFENGFILSNNTTTCTYNDFFPISGKIDMRGGFLYLEKDLAFDKSVYLTSSGNIFAATHSVDFGKTTTDLSISTSLTFDSVSIKFNNDMRINAPMQFRGNCKINAGGNKIILQGNSSIVVRPGGSLIIEDAECTGIKKNNINCLTDSGSLTIRNSILWLTQQYTFSRGSILFDQEVLITGTNKFNYTTGLSSTIDSLSTLFFDSGTTFSYAPRRPYKNLIVMTDVTSNLFLNGCTLYSTRTGIQLLTGSVFFENNVTVTSEGKNSGEALNLDASLSINVLGGAVMNLFGRIRYG